MTKLEPFAEFIRSLPMVDSPLASLRGWMLQTDQALAMFYEIPDGVDLPEHAHGAQWGVVLAGAIDFTIGGDTLEFDIVHQDWGDGTMLPFERHVTAHIAMNEMRIDARRPDQVGPGIVASLVGPIAIEATAGNIVGE